MPILEFPPDLPSGLTPGTAPPDDVVVAFFRAFLPDFYFVNTPISRMQRHLQGISALSQTPLLLDFHQPPGAHFTELTLCASDDAKPGLLSRVAGTLSDLKISIDTAWIHTLRDPHHIESGRRIVLDTLILSQGHEPGSGGTSRPLSPRTQARARAALTPLLLGPNRVPAAPYNTLRRAAPLVISELFAAPQSDGTLQITLHANDDAAVLCRIATTLAQLGLDIAHAQINSFESAVSDLFFVSKSGGAAIEAAEIPVLLESLRRALENDFESER